MAGNKVTFAGIQRAKAAERDRFDALEALHATAVYRPFRQTHTDHRCYPPHCGRRFAVYHTVHGYVVPGTDCGDIDELSAHLARLNRLEARQ